MVRWRRTLCAVLVALLAAVAGCYHYHGIFPWNWDLSERQFPRHRTPEPPPPPSSSAVDAARPDVAVTPPASSLPSS